MAVRARRGFTLLELMVAVAVTGIGVALAAKVAQVVIQQSGKGRQTTDFQARARLMTRQLRQDLRSAGVGSSGAVAVDRNIPAWLGGSIVTPAGFDAIPVVAGANNIVSVSVGGTATLAGSDAVQVVVTDPSTSRRTLGFNPANQTVIGLEPAVDPATPPFNCPSNMIYVSDHSGPTGQGRTQILFVGSYAPDAVNTVDSLQFTIASGSDVMCARVSTYWVDTAGWLHRSDLSSPNAPVIGVGGQVRIDPTNAATDGITPGVLDQQVAYRLSSEVYTQNGQTVPAGQPPASWAFEGQTQNADGLLVDRMWFEVRMVRVNLLMRSLRAITNSTAPRTINRLEDGASLTPVTVSGDLRAEWVTASEPLTNLRFFDLGAPAGTIAEPY